jgi:membrane protease YdiL (CAAX protease family)
MQNSDIASLVLATVGIFLNLRSYGEKTPFLTVRALRAPWDLWSYGRRTHPKPHVATTRNYHPRVILSNIFEGLVSTLKIWPLLVIFSILSQILLPEYPQQDIVRKLKAEDGPNLYKIFWFAGLLSPLVEEFIFRGLLYPMLKKYVGVFWGCVFSSLLFSYIHDNVLSFTLLFLFSVYLTYLYEKNNNLLIPIASHAFFNIIMLTLMLIDAF